MALHARTRFRLSGLLKSFENLHNCLGGRQATRCIQLAVSGYNFTDYETEKKSFSLQVPEYFNFSRDFIDQWAHAEKVGLRDTSVPAFWWVDDDFDKSLKLSFQQLSRISKKVANALTGGCGLKRGDRVIVILPKIPQWWYINVACIRADIILSPGTMLLRTSDIRHRLKLSGAKCIITSPEMIPFVNEAAEGCEDLFSKVVVGEPEKGRPGWLNFNSLLAKASDHFKCVNTKASDPMTLFFTSGTTGYPKICEHSHSSYGLGHLITARYFLMANSKSVVWNLSDTGWAKSAWSSVFAPWIHGACVFIHNSAKFDPLQVLKVLEEYPVSTFCAPPTAFRTIGSEKLSDHRLKALSHCISGGEAVVLCDYPITHFCSSPTGLRIMMNHQLNSFKFKALQHCTSAGEPTNPELIEVWKSGTGLDIHEGYGQTETTLVCSRPPSIPYKPGSMGKAAPGVDLQVVDDDGNVLEPGIEGNLGVKVTPFRPVGLFTKYLDDPERTKNSHRGDYYLTGDRGYMDEEANIYFVGRSDDVINSAGYRIGPFEVESALLEHPSVVESAVVSSPDDLRGEVVKAFVILTDEYKTSDQDALRHELQNHVKTVTAPYKYPRKIEFMDELPKTVSGKIRRVELRNKEWEDA